MERVTHRAQGTAVTPFSIPLIHNTNMSTCEELSTLSKPYLKKQSKM
jgi:hypothetical protein